MLEITVAFCAGIIIGSVVVGLLMWKEIKVEREISAMYLRYAQYRNAE